MSYVSPEAAYEVAAAEAVCDLRDGREVRIEATGSAYDRLGDGSHRAGGDEDAAAERPPRLNAP